MVSTRQPTRHDEAVLGCAYQEWSDGNCNHRDFAIFHPNLHVLHAAIFRGSPTCRVTACEGGEGHERADGEARANAFQRAVQ